MFRCLNLLALGAAAMVSVTAGAADEKPIQILFLGDNGHHRPAERFAQVRDEFSGRGIVLHYVDTAESLNRETLDEYDGLLIYSNLTEITPDQESALLSYVADGHGFIPLHCATYCFLNSQPYIDLCGAQFQKHGTGEFATEFADVEHPILKGFGGFQSWDETYVHHRHNEKDRIVLEYRREGDQADGVQREPWTWVRTHGKGRVFYTAWGHDHRTWGHPGFQNLVERGIRWACGRDVSTVAPYSDPARFDVPKTTAVKGDTSAFEYIDVGPKIPNYTPGERWGTQGAAITLMQKPVSPEISMTMTSVPVGMDVRLYADESHFGGKPIAMSWDHRGRLWVCETVDYPNELQPPDQGRDRISICEDTDGDHVADRFTVFAEGLSIPTAVLFAHDGVIVQNGTQTIYLRDTNGDDKADVKKVLIDNWALGDTHGGVSNFRYGLDNWIWAMQGYNNSAPTIDGRRQQSFRMGFFRFRLVPDGDAAAPRVAEIEFIRSTNNNTWGLGISEEGLIFGSTANAHPSLFMPIANRYYERVRGWSPATLERISPDYKFAPITDKVRQVDQHGGYTAGAGHAVYTARTFPQQWWNRTAFVCGPTGHLVGTFVLEPDGAGFRSKSPLNLFASIDEWTAPIMAEVGPDGAVWVLDWYNYIVQHNPTPQGFETGKGNAYESDLRDKRHGRIYRVVPTDPTESGAEVLHAFAPLDPGNGEQLVGALRHPSMRWRLEAQRLLVERADRDVVPALWALVEDQSVDAVGLNAGAIHALWTLKGLDAIGSDDHGALAHPSAGVRRNAVAVMPRSTELIGDLLTLVNDSDAQVRLAAILALADVPASGEARPEDAAAGMAIARLAGDPAVVSDRWLADAVTSAAAVHSAALLNAVSAQDAPAGNAPQTADIYARIGEHIARGDATEKDVQRLLSAAAKARPQIAAALIRGAAAGWRTSPAWKLSEQSEATLVKVFERLPAGSRGQLIRLASVWKSDRLESYAAEIIESLLEVVENDQQDDDARVTAARELVAFRADDPKVVKEILERLTVQSSPPLTKGLIESATASRAPEVGKLLVDRYASLTPVGREAVLGVLLARAETTVSLLEALENGTLALGDLRLDQRQALATYPDRKVRDRALAAMAKGGGLPDPDRDAVLKELMPLTEATGDVASGKAIYIKHCSACHQHGKEGKAIGPNLTGMSVHPKHELLTHIIDPSRSVEGNFRIYTVAKADGRIISGMLAAETRTSIELIDSEAKRHVVIRDDIDDMAASRKSLMPEGFEKQVTKEQLTDLLEFLTAKGKYVPIPLDRYATVISTKGMFSNGDNGPDRIRFIDWSPKMVGEVPFVLTDPLGDKRANVVLLNGPFGTKPPSMPKSVTVPCRTAATRIHLLSGIGGWSFPFDRARTTSMIVRLHYADDSTEDHELINGIHFADYIRRVDVEGSEFAFDCFGQQVRYLSIEPMTRREIREIEFVKGNDSTAPLVIAVTVERPE